MKNSPFLGLIAAAACLAAAPARAQPIKHQFLAIDEGLNNLMRVDESDPKQNWLVHISPPHPRDMQLEGGGHLLISHDRGYSEYDIATGKLVKEVTAYHDVSSVRRLENGHILVVGVDFDGPKMNRGWGPLGDPTGRHVVFGEFDANDKLVRRTVYVGDYARLVRETSKGTYLCGENTKFSEGDKDGNWIREFPVEGFMHAWMALRLPNGDTLMSSGYGTTMKNGNGFSPPLTKGSAFMVEVDPDGKVVRKFGAADQVPAAVHPYFYAMFQLLPNGDIVVANWQGHFAGHNYNGEQIVEFDPQGAVVWNWSDRAFVSSIQGVLVLDGLNPALLYDERNGVMEPLNPAQNP
ncbi:MAG: hypothetical protein ABSA05_05640 [Opitutaceae bacterium]|jgi:hypothetical protein